MEKIFEPKSILPQELIFPEGKIKECSRGKNRGSLEEVFIIFNLEMDKYLAKLNTYNLPTTASQ